VTLGSKLAMVGCLAASYGTCASFAARYLYPSKPRPTAWVYVIEAARLAPGAGLEYQTPLGEPVLITRRGEGDAAESFLALSSTCPHLGCRVRWQAQEQLFHCPCHNGVFEPGGRAIAGPPAAAGQSLGRFPLEVRDGLLYIQVPVEQRTV
jgi:Rieske Fe-S protein